MTRPMTFSTLVAPIPVLVLLFQLLSDLTPVQQDNGPMQLEAQNPTTEVLHEEAPYSRARSVPCKTAGDEVSGLPTAEPKA